MHKSIDLFKLKKSYRHKQIVCVSHPLKPFMLKIVVAKKRMMGRSAKELKEKLCKISFSRMKAQRNTLKASKQYLTCQGSNQTEEVRLRMIKQTRKIVAECIKFADTYIDELFNSLFLYKDLNGEPIASIRDTNAILNLKGVQPVLVKQTTLDQKQLEQAGLRLKQYSALENNDVEYLEKELPSYFYRCLDYCLRFLLIMLCFGIAILCY